MTWMNEYDVETAERQFADHPVMGPAVATLGNLVGWTNRNSDGWPYWGKPSRAAERLQSLITQAQRQVREGGEPLFTAQEVKATLVPIKAFRTRCVNKGMPTFTIVAP